MFYSGIQNFSNLKGKQKLKLSDQCDVNIWFELMEVIKYEWKIKIDYNY